MIGVPIYIKTIQPFTHVENKAIGQETGEIDYLPIIVMSEMFHTGSHKYDFRKVKLPFYILKDNLAKYIINWFKYYEIHKPAINVYLTNSFIEDLYIEQEFLNLIQAVETLHNRIFSNQRLNIPRKNKKMSKRRQPNLWERIEFLIDYYWDDYLVKFVEKDIFDDLLVGKADFCRNYLTHYDLEKESKKQEMFEDEDDFIRVLLRIKKCLNLLVTIIIMDLLEVPKEIVHRLDELNMDYQEINNYIKGL
jgi:hypothetical protein